MKKGQEFEGPVVSMSYPNVGLVQTEEGTVTVKNALKGQVVRGVVTKTRDKKAEGRLVSVLSRAAEEQADYCPHFGVCGGCLMGSLPYETQLSLKQKELEELFSELLPASCMFEKIQASPRERFYRNKMEYTFGNEEKDGPLTLGLHARGSFYDITDVTECKIADEDFSLIRSFTQQFFRERNLPFYHRMTHVGVLRHLLVRKTAKTGQILIDLVTSTQDEEGLAAVLPDYVNALLALPVSGTVTGILHTVNDSVADVVKDEGTTVLYGKDSIEEEILGMHFLITPFSFFQTNSCGAEVLYEKVREYAGATDNAVIYDLYCGTGTIAQLLAPVAKRVTGVEIVPEACAAARINVERNHLTNCSFIEGDVLAFLQNMTESPDLFVLDPPRDGVSPKALHRIIGAGAKRIVYVSCKATSLKRDLVSFFANGYTAERLCSVDMFPATGNIETVVLLSKE